MNISNLEQYVEHRNRIRKIFGEPELSLLGANDRKIIADMIDGDLSPENLTCDGEAPAAYVRQKHAYLCRCAQELLSIDSTVEFFEYDC